jgi:ATP-dependent exoDNAse (exonuclease V) beta subunit
MSALHYFQWRVILSAVDENLKGTQVFSHEKHYIISSELKYLYVAITRSKQRIWICDESVEYSKPIQMYWKNLGLIKIVQSEDKILSTLAKKSDSHEWEQKGKEFFEQRQYEQVKTHIYNYLVLYY